MKYLAFWAYSRALWSKPSRLRLSRNSAMRSSTRPAWLVSLDMWFSCCCPSRGQSGERSYGEYPTDRGRAVWTRRRPTLHNELLTISNARTGLVSPIPFFVGRPGLEADVRRAASVTGALVRENGAVRGRDR